MRAATRGRRTSSWWSRSPTRVWRTTAGWGKKFTARPEFRLLDRQPGPSPGRGLHRTGARGLSLMRGRLGRPERLRGDRGTVSGPDCRRRPPALAAANDLKNPMRWEGQATARPTIAGGQVRSLVGLACGSTNPTLLPSRPVLRRRVKRQRGPPRRPLNSGGPRLRLDPAYPTTRLPSRPTMP